MNLPIPSTAFPTPEHNHDHCLDEAMVRARKAFEAKGLRLTPLREAVFQEIAAASHQAIGAYEVLERMANRGERLAPISVYRAIDALVTAGIVHRFESRNAFFACHAGHEQRQLVLACERCNAVAEVDGAKVFAAIDKAADAALFRPARARLPWSRCGDCAPIAPARTRTMRSPDGLGQQPGPHGEQHRHGQEHHDDHGTAHDHDHAGHMHDHHHAHAHAQREHNATALISARNLMLARGGRTILADIDIDISPREIVTVIGPNGAGKTTLVRALLGLEPVDQGSIRRKPGLVTGYAPQRFDVDRAIPLTVSRFVALGRRAGPR